MVKLLSLVGKGEIGTLTACKKGQATLRATLLKGAQSFTVCKAHQYFTRPSLTALVK